MTYQTKLLIVILLSILFSNSARADFIWAPAIYYWGVLTWWIIVIGLLIEIPFYFVGFKLSIVKTLYATLLANLFSLIIGLIIWYPLANASWFIESILQMFGAFSSVVVMIGGPILTLYISTKLELFTVSKMFRTQITSSNTKYLLIANILSLTTTFLGAFYLYSKQHN